ncbi:hypothetical protein TWF281_002028 [Arthrobotrys megalospora]
MPNLACYSIRNTDFMQNAAHITPTIHVYSNITYLSLSFLNFTASIYRAFQDLPTSLPSIKDLTLDKIGIYLPNSVVLRPQGEDTRIYAISSSRDCTVPNSPFGEYGFVITPGETLTPRYSFSELPAAINWTSIFKTIGKGFPKLTNFKFKRLVYSRCPSLRSSNVLLLIPVPDKKDYDWKAFQKFAKNTANMELISVHESDYQALDGLRREVNKRRQNDGLPSLEGDELAEDMSGLPYKTKEKCVARVSPYNIWNDCGNSRWDDIYFF